MENNKMNNGKESTSRLTDDEIVHMVKEKPGESMLANTPLKKRLSEIVPTTTRKLIVVGCGDGGCNIASAIANRIPDETFTIAYNTSDRNIQKITADTRIVATLEKDEEEESMLTKPVDGAGRVRDYSQDLFRDPDTHRNLFKTIYEQLPADYILVCGTCGGGTGSGTGPLLASLLRSNLDVPVIMLGVFPSTSEDATSQYNSIDWMSEVIQEGVPYIILDNNVEGTPMSTQRVHEKVNQMAADIAALLAGTEYGNSTISIIDNRNLYMLLQELGGRIVVGISSTRPTSGQTLDDYILNMLKNNYQPEPSNVRGIGVFVKGPKEMLDRMDTSIPKVQETYGYGVLNFAHIEESQDVKIAILLTGCSEPVERMVQIKNRHDDVLRSQQEAETVAVEMATSIANPLKNFTKKKGTKKTLNMDSLNLGALKKQ